MTTRNAILTAMKTELLKLDTANGYELNYPYQRKGALGIADAKKFPQVCYDIGTQSSIAEDEIDAYSLQLKIWVYLKAAKDNSEAMIAMRESAISDVSKFLYGDKSIAEGKCFDWFSIAQTYGIRKFDLKDVIHATNFNDGLCGIEFTSQIEHYSTHESEIISELI